MPGSQTAGFDIVRRITGGRWSSIIASLPTASSRADSPLFPNRTRNHKVIATGLGIQNLDVSSEIFWGRHTALVKETKDPVFFLLVVRNFVNGKKIGSAQRRMRGHSSARLDSHRR
jgi:hypothetical protein